MKMRYANTHSNQKNSTITVRVMCAIVFCLFSFCWLYWSQADVMAVTQHVLSGGATRYDRTVGAVLITAVLQVLQLIVSNVTGLYRRTHALTYLPSMLLLALMSSISTDIAEKGFSLGAWCWTLPLILLGWGVCVWFAKQLLPFQTDKEPLGVFARRSWVNMLQMVVMMLFVAMIGNTNAAEHFRAHLETALQKKDVDEALRTGRKSQETNVHLTMLRAYALSLKGELGERLFEYPIVGQGNDLLPLPTSRSRLLLLPSDTLFMHLGAIPRGSLKASRYYDLLERDSFATSAVADYRLCGLLVDRQLDAFARVLPRYYAVNDSLPKHYKEALTLYTHQRSKPTIVFRNAVLDEDWQDFQQLTNRYPDLNERKGKIEEHYAMSYWYYYFYQKK